MDLHVRALGPDDFGAVMEVENAAFSESPPAVELDQMRATTEWDRMFGALDGDQLAGVTGAYAMELTVPGPGIVPTSGVTAVAVRPTHRRRGVLRALMAHQLEDVAARGEPVAVLTASEATIYRRFGYGVASVVHPIEIDRSRSAFVPTVPAGAPAGDVEVRLLSREQAVDLAPGWFDAFRRSWPGQVSRPATWWPIVFGEHQTWKGGGGQFVVAAEAADRGPGGYATYRVITDPGSNGRRLEVRELVAADPVVARALWRYLFDVDLVTTIVAEVGVDDPLRWWLADFRAMRVTGERDFLWARIVDPAAALAARRYEREAELVVEVVDGFCPGVAGRYLVAGGPGGAEAERTSRPADLVMDVADLGSLYLGGFSARTLASSGRIDERSAGAVVVADAFFGSSSTRPCCATRF
ncbi:MAG: GNAT family N-acetyltransferase [Acidimicrobiales bacterium]